MLIIFALLVLGSLLLGATLCAWLVGQMLVASRQTAESYAEAAIETAKPDWHLMASDSR